MQAKNCLHKFYTNIQENPHISRNELSKKIGLSETSIYNNIQKLKAQGFIERIGADKNGR